MLGHQDGDGKIDINGFEYTRGIVHLAPGVIKFSLGSKYDRFSVCIGISKLHSDGRCGVNLGDARFRVLGDDGVLRNWKIKSSPQDPTCFGVVITDVNELILETDLNGSADCDLSTWADAKVAAGIVIVRHLHNCSQKFIFGFFNLLPFRSIIAIFFTLGDVSHVCYCEYKNGASPQNGIMCGYNGESFSRVDNCGIHNRCIGPTEDDSISKRIPSFRKTELCSRGS